MGNNWDSTDACWDYKFTFPSDYFSKIIFSLVESAAEKFKDYFKELEGNST